MSEEAQVANEAVVDSATPKADGDDLNQKFVAEIANSKKLRSRAQEAEALNPEGIDVIKLQKQLKLSEENKLKEKEEYKTLYEQQKVVNEQDSPDAERWRKHESETRESLLLSIPEPDREKWAKAELPLLADYVSKVNAPKSANPDHVSNQTRNAVTEDWTKMSKDDKKKNWQSILNQYKN